MKTNLPCTTFGELNFDGITELTEGGQKEFLDRINKINRIGAEGRQGDFDRRNMRADEGDLFRQVPRRLFLKELCFQPRSGCKTLSYTPAHGRVCLRNPLQVGGGGEKVDFLQGRGNGLHLRSTVPLGRAAPFWGYPAINRWATFDCPSGTSPEFGLTPCSGDAGLDQGVPCRAIKYLLIGTPKLVLEGV